MSGVAVGGGAVTVETAIQKGTVSVGLDLNSINFYVDFNLDMDRSPGFGSAFTDFFALLRLDLSSASHL